MALKKPTLPSILKTFTKMQDQLNSLIATNEAKVDGFKTKITELHDKKDVLIVDNRKAKAILKNIDALIDN